MFQDLSLCLEYQKERIKQSREQQTTVLFVFERCGLGKAGGCSYDLLDDTNTGLSPVGPEWLKPMPAGGYWTQGHRRSPAQLSHFWWALSCSGYQVRKMPFILKNKEEETVSRCHPNSSSCVPVLSRPAG